ncbi:MAG TPA: response regulator [Acidobacteriaceae bacterium]
MTSDICIKILDAITKLSGPIAWPFVLLFFLIIFHSPLRKLIENISELSLKIGGMEVSLKRQITGATAGIVSAQAATRIRAGSLITSDAVAKDIRETIELVTEVVTPETIRRTKQSKILWVDDQPNNNVHEREAFEALGIRFIIATSTEEAVDELRYRSFDAIISDMGRPSDDRAGYTLLEMLRRVGNRTPFIIYSGERTPEFQAEAWQRGAVGCTNRPDELFEMVLSQLVQHRKRSCW